MTAKQLLTDAWERFQMDRDSKLVAVLASCPLPKEKHGKHLDAYRAAIDGLHRIAGTDLHTFDRLHTRGEVVNLFTKAIEELPWR